MDTVSVYRHATSTRSRLYPALVATHLIPSKCKPGGVCQAGGCEEHSTFLRAWLCPDGGGNIKVAHLNGVRFCGFHASAMASGTELPLLHNESNMTSYQTRIRSIEDAFAAGEPKAPVAMRVVGKEGIALAGPDGTLSIILKDGSNVGACCRYVAAAMIGVKVPGRTEVHHPSCNLASEVGLTALKC